MLGKLGRKITLAALVGASSIVISGNTAHAGQKQLKLANGADAGWVASWDDAFDNYVGISIDSVNLQNGTVVIQKSINFTDGMFYNPLLDGKFNPMVITFTQTSADAVSNIVINDEPLANNSGLDWNGFSMFLMNGGATFDPAQSADFNVDPFTNKAFVDGNTRLNIDGGILHDGESWFPGGGPDFDSQNNPLKNQLWINVNPSQADANGNWAPSMFVLKEQPNAIPLPAAAWSGLSGLAGLALLGSRKKIRAVLA